MRSFVRPGWQKSDWWLVVLFVACLIAGFLFAGVGSRVLQGDLRELDRSFRDFAIAHRHPVWMSVLTGLSYLANKPVLVTIAAAGAWYISRSLTLVVLVFACGFASQEMVHGLKDIFARIRPETGMLQKESLSFPSGHASGTAAVATLLGFASLRQRRAPWIIIPTLALITILMALSRIFLDMHWLSDVIGGVLVGSALGFGFCVLYELLTIRGRLRRPASVSPAATDPAGFAGSSYGGSAPPSAP